MSDARIAIMPMAAALGALSTGFAAVPADAALTPQTVDMPQNRADAGTPNTIVSTGRDLLGFTVTEQSDGSVVAQHVSHASHASHASHHSHYSSR